MCVCAYMRNISRRILFYRRNKRDRKRVEERKREEEEPFVSTNVPAKESRKGVWKGRKEGEGREERGGGAEGKERKREEAETARFGSTTRLTLRRRPGRLRGCRSTLLLGHPYPHPYPRGWIEAGRPIFRAPLDSSSPLVAALSPSLVTSHPP